MIFLFVRIATAFVTSLLFGFAALKTYGLFQRGLKSTTHGKFGGLFPALSSF